MPQASTTRNFAPDAFANVRHALSPSKISAIYLGIVFIVVFSILQPDTFPTTTTFRLIATEGVVVAVLALAFLIPLAANQFDLSIGAVMSLSLVITTWIAANTSLNPLLGALIAMIICAGVGGVSGFIIVKLRVNSFIATLGVSQVLLAIVLLISENRQISGAFSADYLKLGRDDVLGIPLVVVYLAVLALLLWYVIEYTPAGRALFAVGGNPEAARLSGINSDRVVWMSMVGSALMAGASGIIFSMKVGNFSTSTGPSLLVPGGRRGFPGCFAVLAAPERVGDDCCVLRPRDRHQGAAAPGRYHSYWVRPLFEGMALIIAVAMASRSGATQRGSQGPEKTEEAISGCRETGAGVSELKSAS